MKTLALHLFLPHETNNFRPKTLHFSALLFYIAFFLLLQASFRIIRLSHPEILGYATDINVEKLLNLTNLKRVEAGLSPLNLNPKLSQAAVAKANDMFKKGYWAHNAPDGTTPWVFISQVGYQYLYAGENLARDFSNSEGVVSAWMASPSHRDNILKREYQDIGFAVVNGKLNGEETTLVVQFFGTPQPLSLATKQVTIPQVASITSATPTPTPSSVVVLPPPVNPLTPTVISSLGNLQISRYPLIDFFATTRGFASLLISALLGILSVDGLVIWRRKIIRISGHNLAHIIFLASLLGALWVTSQGAIL